MSILKLMPIVDGPTGAPRASIELRMVGSFAPGWLSSASVRLRAIPNTGPGLGGIGLGPSGILCFGKNPGDDQLLVSCGSCGPFAIGICAVRWRARGLFKSNVEGLASGDNRSWCPVRLLDALGVLATELALVESGGVSKGVLEAIGESSGLRPLAPLRVDFPRARLGFILPATGFEVIGSTLSCFLTHSGSGRFLANPYHATSGCKIGDHDERESWAGCVRGRNVETKPVRRVNKC
mmetsp:Transcript_65637/g.181647  ORF Transcript_65637/g.181647 Transcript_65637/m.181647 type:complete len:237 (-) Transcript_65637:239-949(-)